MHSTGPQCISFICHQTYRFIQQPSMTGEKQMEPSWQATCTRLQIFTEVIKLLLFRKHVEFKAQVACACACFRGRGWLGLRSCAEPAPANLHVHAQIIIIFVDQQTQQHPRAAICSVKFVYSPPFSRSYIERYRSIVQQVSRKSLPQVYMLHVHAKLIVAQSQLRIN